MDKNNSILISILAILTILLMTSISNEFRFHRMENKMDEFFAPIDDVTLPEWKEGHNNGDV